MRTASLFLAAMLAVTARAADQAAPTSGGTPAQVLASPPAQAPQQQPSPVLTKWQATLYGFAELDAIYDSTEAANDLQGNQRLAKDNSYARWHGRVQMGVRNSRLGFKLASPEFNGMRGTGVIEADFFGAAPAGSPNTAGSPSESGFFTSPGLRVRHAFLKLETPIVDVLGGQYWELFGWQPYFHPNSVQIQGLPGQVFSRAPQLRVSKMFKGSAVNVEAAVAASRPPQRDGQSPDGQGGLRILANDWKGLHTGGSTGTSVDAAAIGVSGAARRFMLPKPGATGADAIRSDNVEVGWGYSVDAFLPIVRGSAADRSNAFCLTGSFVRGFGTADLYTGLNGGIGSPGTATGATLPNGYTPIDAGLVAYDANGNLKAIQWTSAMVGAQYYLPFGNLWLAVNGTWLNSDNIADLARTPAAAYGNGGNANVFKRQRYADVNLFWDATPAARFGVAYAWTEQQFGDNSYAHNNRVQLSTWYIF